MIYCYLSDCDYFDVSQIDCVVYIKQEMERKCGSDFSCVQTSRGDWASMKNYANMTDKLVSFVQ